MERIKRPIFMQANTLEKPIIIKVNNLCINLSCPCSPEGRFSSHDIQVKFYGACSNERVAMRTFVKLPINFFDCDRWVPDDLKEQIVEQINAVYPPCYTTEKMLTVLHTGNCSTTQGCVEVDGPFGSVYKNEW
jgi:hypothetical protein